MAQTVLNDGASHTISSGTYDGILVDLSTTLAISGGTSTGAASTASVGGPPTVFTGGNAAIPGLIAARGSNVSVSGGTFTGGDSVAGEMTGADFDAGTGEYLDGPQPGFAAYGSTTVVNITGGTFQGGSYSPATDTLALMGGAPGGLISGLNPSNVTLNAGTYTGGVSESTLDGPPALSVSINSASNLDIEGGTYNPGTGASNGPALYYSNSTANILTIAGGHWNGSFSVSIPAGGKLRFEWQIGSPGTLTTTSVSGTLYDGTAISQSITGGGGATVFNDTSATPPYSELQF